MGKYRNQILKTGLTSMFFNSGKARSGNGASIWFDSRQTFDVCFLASVTPKRILGYWLRSGIGMHKRNTQLEVFRMAMSKKDYARMAAVIKDNAESALLDDEAESKARLAAISDVMSGLTEVLKADNPRFDSGKFHAACGFKLYDYIGFKFEG